MTAQFKTPEMQEQIIRKVTLVGNGAHIFVPKEWLGKNVIVSKAQEKTLNEKIFSLIEPHLESIIGVYLYGSQARNEAQEDSDIDLLIITLKDLKIKQLGFEIICLKENELDKAIKSSPEIMYSIIAEAKPIINPKLLQELREKHTPNPSDFKKFINSTEKIIRINSVALKEEEKLGKETLDTSSAYSIMLRLRGLFIISNLLKNKPSSNKDFKNWIESNIQNIEYSKIYAIYRAVKNSIPIKQKIKISDLKLLLSFLIKETKLLKNK